MMDRMDMSVMAVAMLLGVLALLAVIAAAVYVGIRATRPRRGLDAGGAARAMLDQRLATGEIDPEEYYERESALRDAAPTARRGKRVLRT